MTPVQGVDQPLWYILGIAVVLLSGITMVMVCFVVRYRRSKKTVASDIRDNYKLEIIWTIVPTLIALSLLVIGWFPHIGLLTGLLTVPKDAMVVEVLAQQSSWIFIYNNDKETKNELVVPVGRAVRLKISSIDGPHSFYLPAFRIKVDAVRGTPTYAWFLADQLGDYVIKCTESCGVDHSAIVATLKIIPENEFATWLKKESD